MIDSTIFAVDIPAGTYAAGQKIPLNVIRGPSVVRAGYGKAILKQVMMFTTSSMISAGTYFEFKNANWNDTLKTLAVSAGSAPQSLTILSRTSPAIQRCGDTELQPNSSFEVNLVIGSSITTTTATTAILLMDIDYPSVAAVANPRNEEGMPVSIVRSDSVAVTADGAAASMVWTTYNVDEFKAGYRYLLAQIGAYNTAAMVGFVEFSGAPSMNGLVRVIPVIPSAGAAARMELEYSTPLVKGPMNISYAALGTAGTVTMPLECDYIRRE